MSAHTCKFAKAALFVALGAGISLIPAQDTGFSGTVPARMTVTVEGKQDASPPVLTQDDVMVTQENHRMRVTGWEPCKTSHAGLQFWILIDDTIEGTVANRYDDIRKFIAGQPPTTEIGIGYMANGTVKAAVPLTTDHARAAKALRLPMGIVGASASPYISLSDLIKKWPATEARREVLMITSGIDLYYGPGPEDPYLLTSIDDAQKAGVIVHSIYFGAIGHYGHDMWQIQWGQNDLAQLSDATGGEAYWQGFINPISFTPYMEDLNRRLENQYELTFLAQPGKKSELQPVHLSTEVAHVTLVTARRVWVPLTSQ